MLIMPSSVNRSLIRKGVNKKKEVKSANKYTERSGQEKPKFSGIYKIFFVYTSGTKLAYTGTKSSVETERPEPKELPGSLSSASSVGVQNLCSLQLHHQHFAAFRELLALLSTLKKENCI